jgi:hypothetical protein
MLFCVGSSTTIFALPKVYHNFEKQKGIFKYTSSNSLIDSIASPNVKTMEE